MQALAARTGYSRSSWDRYLNGRALPPQQAVDALARACDLDPARLLALHEVALHEMPGDSAADGRDPQERGRRRWVLVSVSAVAVTALAVTALVLGRPWDGGGARTAAQSSAAGTGNAPGKGTFVFRVGVDHPCKVRRDKNGLLYAGYSRTRTALIGRQSVQWPVVEAQCLLRHHGFPPGLADGFYGPRTERAVERLQDKAHIVVDGVVGEDTWRVLRK